MTATVSLTRRVRSGVSWTASSSLAMHALSLVRSIVLARLLTKDDFGLFGMAVTIIGALTVLTELGLDGSLIANKFKDEAELKDQLNTIWTVELGRRLLLTLLLLAAVYPTALFYGDERLLKILPILSMVPLLQGFGNIGLIVLRRQVNFAPVVVFDLTCAVAQSVVPIALALWTRNFWALVWGQVIAVAFCDVVSYLFRPHWPRFRFDRAAFLRAFDFGKYIFIIGIMSYIVTTADNIYVGKLLGTEVLGAYVVAYSLASLPSTLFSRVFGGILFPTYAELGREGGERLERAVVRIFLLATATLVLLVAPVALLSNDLVVLLYGDKWKVAGPILQILMIMGFARGLLHLVGPLLMGLNRPDLEARAKTVEAIFFLIILIPLTHQFGAIGAAWAGVLIAMFSSVVRFSYVRALVPVAFARIPAIVATAVLAGAIGALAGQAAIEATGAATPLARCLLGGLVALAVTTLLLALFKPDLRHETARLLRR